MKTRVAVSWSGGKDSALVLDRLLRDQSYEVVALVTTFDASCRRVSAHGIPVDLIERQAHSIGVPFIRVELPINTSYEVYVRQYLEALQPVIDEGLKAVAFGGISFAQFRCRLEESFISRGVSALYPLREMPSRRLAEEFVGRGFAAVVCCVNGAFLEQRYLGRLYGWAFIEQMPARIDRCGENGEFHTFVFDGPIFHEPVQYVIGKSTYKPTMRGSPVSGHWFCEIKAKQMTAAACPLCGEDNQCGVMAGRAMCWCYTERISEDVRERVPPYARDVACVCPRCAGIERA